MVWGGVSQYQEPCACCGEFVLLKPYLEACVSSYGLLYVGSLISRKLIQKTTLEAMNLSVSFGFVEVPGCGNYQQFTIFPNLHAFILLTL